MTGRPALFALLSQVFVAFTIEFDNAFELLTPHRTTDYGGSPTAPWLVSRVFWDSVLRFIPEEGIALSDLEKLTGTSARTTDLWLTRLSSWWGYVVAEPGRQRGRTYIRLTAGGFEAVEIWKPLTGEIERRWQDRFGERRFANLLEALGRVARQLDPKLPGALPILGYGLWTLPPEVLRVAPAPETLPGLVAKVLYAFALEFERESGLALAIHANILRLLGPEPVTVANVARFSGVSREAVATSMNFLKKMSFVAEAKGIRPKSLILSPTGVALQSQCASLLVQIEQSWHSRFGAVAVEDLGQCLGSIVADPSFLLGLASGPGNWRAEVPVLENLPHFPMILHRGGFPDGS